MCCVRQVDRLYRSGGHMAAQVEDTKCLVKEWHFIFVDHVIKVPVAFKYLVF